MSNMTNWMPFLSPILNRLHLFYPVGLPNLSRDYSGYKLYQEILSQKINDIDGDTVWRRFTTGIQNLVEWQMFDMNYLQFPGHIVRFNLFEETNVYLKHQRYLYVAVSLLGPFYTMFFNDIVIYTGKSDKIRQPQLSVVFSSGVDGGKQQTFDYINGQVATFFNGHQFVPHDLLFTYKVTSCVPYTEEVDSALNNYPIYSLLFDSFFSIENLHVRG